MNNSCRRAILYAFCDLHLPRCPAISLDENWSNDTITSLASGSRCKYVKNYRYADLGPESVRIVSRCRFVNSLLLRIIERIQGFIDGTFRICFEVWHVQTFQVILVYVVHLKRRGRRLPRVYNPSAGYDRTSNYTCDSFLVEYLCRCLGCDFEEIYQSATDIALAGIPAVIGTRCASI